MSEDLYNPVEKEEFLESIELDDVKHLYNHLFARSKGAEMLYQKDLYAFTLEQLEDVMKNINPATMNSVANSKSRINHYITWAIRHGRRKNNINPLQGTDRDWGKKFIDSTVKRHLSDVELHDIVEGLHNAQDQALIQCIFEGIMGQGLSEILSMNYKNINWNNNIIKVYNSKDDDWREVTVSDKCMRYISNAYKQTTYLSEDTETEKELVEHHGNIFKNVKWRSSRFPEVSRSNLVKRLYVIKEVYELEEFTALSINEAGRIKLSVDLYKEKGKITKDELAIVGDHFNLSKIQVREYRYYDISKIKNYINSTNIRKLYGIDVEIE